MKRKVRKYKAHPNTDTMEWPLWFYKIAKIKKQPKPDKRYYRKRR